MPPAAAAQPAGDAPATGTQEDWQRALAQLSGRAAEDRRSEQERQAAEEFGQLAPMGVPQQRQQDFRKMISSARQPIRLGITRG